jgi:hypothetical protein
MKANWKWAASSRAATPPKARNVVLVHGAWADGSSWAEVIARFKPPA